MKPNDEQIKTGSLLADTPFDRVYSWGFETNEGFKAEMKHIDRKESEWWCAYLFLSMKDLSSVNAKIEGEDCNIDCPHIPYGVTFFEQVGDDEYKIGWDYMHAQNIMKKDTGSFDSVKADIEKVSEWIASQKQNSKELKKEKQKERKDANMELAYKEDDGGWERVNEFHWTRRLNGKQLIYWPSKRKYQYQTKIMRGDVYKFILSVQEKVKRK